ncbi:TonB family protein [Massilia sp. TSP1-1-2]|uniref:TonB family protein n=1 Tax=unclassified Massilia TaxID=2609279 RepID=UPI003CEC400D
MLSTKPRAALATVVAVFAVLSLSATVPAMAAGSSAPRINQADCEAPYFPARWHDDADGASVVVGYLIGADGKVIDSKIVQSSGVAHIDRASERAGARCTFVPAQGRTVEAAWTKVKYAWVVN